MSSTSRADESRGTTSVTSARKVQRSLETFQDFRVSSAPESARHDKRVKTLRNPESRGNAKERSTKEVKVRGYAIRLFKRVKGKLAYLLRCKNAAEVKDFLFLFLFFFFPPWTNPFYRSTSSGFFLEMSHEMSIFFFPPRAQIVPLCHRSVRPESSSSSVGREFSWCFHRGFRRSDSLHCASAIVQ